MKLGAFAAVNAAMALLVPILGRRDVVKKLTIGFCGQRGSPMWLLTGPATVVLHIASNAIAAYLIKSTPGFGAVDIGQLVLLWCTRPRLAWMIVVLLPWQAKDAIYLSVASSTLLAEIILQAIGAYYMGIATNYARRQKFYLAGRLTNGRTPRERDALIMYTGSIMWLSVILIAIATCLWSILGVNDYVKAIGAAIRGLDRKAKKYRDALTSQRELLSSSLNQYSSGRRSDRNPHTLETLEATIDNAYDPVQGALTGLEVRWELLLKYVATGAKSVTDAHREVRRQKSLLRKPQGYEVVLVQRAYSQAEEKYEEVYSQWQTTPAEQLDLLNAGMLADLPHRLEVSPAILKIHEYLERSVELQRRHARRIVELNKSLDTLRKHIQLHAAKSGEGNGLENGIQQRRYTEKDFLREQLNNTGQGDVAHYNELKSWLEKVWDGVSLAQQVPQLVGPQNPQGDEATIAGLTILVERELAEQEYLRLLLRPLKSIDSAWWAVDRERKPLERYWGKLKRKREKEGRDSAKGAMLKKIAWRTVVGIMGCWIAQWVWWIGYVRVTGDS
jgi:hypothetical protein